MGERVRYRVIVSGEVQGVWFRQSCRRVASELALGGWVRNRPDGTVEAVFEGPEPDVAKAVAWCRVGPPAAKVTGVDVVAEPPTDLGGFSVR
ncbi:MAG TPA: acylphosphatase [Desertimonas sp.]|nr:acylphosphatase [Desertimonas sp.]